MWALDGLDCMKRALQDELFANSRNYLTLGRAVPLGSASPQAVKASGNTKS